MAHLTAGPCSAATEIAGQGQVRGYTERAKHRLRIYPNVVEVIDSLDAVKQRRLRGLVDLIEAWDNDEARDPVDRTR